MCTTTFIDILALVQRFTKSAFAAHSKEALLRKRPADAKFSKDYPDKASDQKQRAEQIMAKLARIAYRREVAQADIDSLMKFYEQSAAVAGFDAGIESRA